MRTTRESQEACKTGNMSNVSNVGNVSNMSKTYAFLLECDYFIVATVNGAQPAARPFGAVMEHNGALYISTANTKDVYAQLIKNPSIQLVAMKPNSGDWIRINGRAVETKDPAIKQAMLEACPVLRYHFETNESAHFALFEMTDRSSLLYTANNIESLS